jgi:NADH-quinone oxidoreductase subunit H
MIQLAVTLVSAIFLIWLERKIKARSQYRIGPPIYQPILDLAKLFQKQNLRSSLSNPLMNFLPLISLLAVALIAYSLPLGNLGGSIDIISLIFLFALTSLIYVFAGLLSYSHYGFVGAKRELIQFFAFEIPFAFGIFSVAILAGTIYFYHPFPFSIVLIPSMIAFYIAGLAKLRRSPFDIPNAEQEIVAGALTEFSGPSLSVFLLSEWMEAFVICSVFVDLFFGFNDALISVALSYMVFISFILIDVVTPRARLDNMINFFRKFVIPLSVFGVVLCYLWTL